MISLEILIFMSPLSFALHGCIITSIEVGEVVGCVEEVCERGGRSLNGSFSKLILDLNKIICTQKNFLKGPTS